MRRWTACAALAAVLAGSAAAEQGEEARKATVTPPAERLMTTPTGVDMRSGQYAYSQTDLSIGEDNETGGLGLTRGMIASVPGHINPFANFSHNWDVMIWEKRIDIDEGRYDGTGPDYRMHVSFGGRSETFEAKAEDSGYHQVSYNWRASLTFASGTRDSAAVVYTYTAADGTVVAFRPLGNGDCSSVYRCAYVSQVTYPDGTRFSFEYDPGPGPTRLRAVVSNRGYALLLRYGTGADSNHVASSCVINLAAQVKPADNVCPVSPLGNSSYAYSTFENKRRLAAATDAAGSTSGFTYARISGTLRMGFVRPGEGSAWLTNRLTERTDNEGVSTELVERQDFADGTRWTYTWTFAPPVEGEVAQVAGGSYIDGGGGTTVIEFGFPLRPASFNPPRVKDAGYPFIFYGDMFHQITSGPISITDPLGRITTMDYCDPLAAAGLPPQENNRCLVTMLQSYTDPEGLRTELTYDGHITRNVIRVRRIAKPGTVQPNGQPWPDIVTTATYSCTNSIVCNRATSTTDANGNTTNFIWDTTHGGLLSETAPAPGEGSPRPQTRHVYEQRYAWISNGTGGYIQTATPIWVRVSTSICRTSAATGNSAAPCAIAGDEVLTLYDYGPNSGPNNLLLRGQAVTSTDGGVSTTLRTCYGYDPRGRRISETAPNANLASCP